MEKSYLLRMTEEEHRKMKVKAAELGIDLKQLIIRAVEKYEGK